jgi:hypothetical protein
VPMRSARTARAVPLGGEAEAQCASGAFQRDCPGTAATGAVRFRLLRNSVCEPAAAPFACCGTAEAKPEREARSTPGAITRLGPRSTRGLAIRDRGSRRRGREPRAVCRHRLSQRQPQAEHYVFFEIVGRSEAVQHRL